MLTTETDSVYSTFQNRLASSLEKVGYKGPMQAEQAGLTDDLLDGLIEIVFEVLGNCLGATNKSASRIAADVQQMNGLQQAHMNVKIRKRLFDGNKRAYNKAGGRKISDALVHTVKEMEHDQLVMFMNYVKTSSEGLTVYPEL